MNNNDMTTAGVAARIGVTVRAVLFVITKGHLTASRHGRAYVITEANLAEYLRRKAAGEVPGVGRPRKNSITKEREEAKP